jgi:hypothetical protein
VRFSTDHGTSLVRLGLSRTRLAPSSRTSRLLFSEGLVRNVVVTRVQGDSLSVAVALRENTTYRCVQPSGGNEVHIDVFPKERTGVAGSAPRLPSVAQGTAQDRAGEQETRDRVIGLIDVAAIARAQVEMENPPAGRARQRMDSPVAGPAEAGSPLLLVGMMIMVALTSGGFVFLVMRRTVPVRVQPVPSAILPSQHHSPSRGMVTPADEDQLPAGIQEEPGEEEDGERETSLQLARSFRRGSEEITLARRLHAQPAAPLSVGKMQQMLARSTTQTQRLHAARKLGVGRGELDLALKLKTLRPAQPKTEEDV